MNEFQKWLKSKGIKQWQAAERAGMREDAFSRMMRRELPEEEQNRLIELIEKNSKKGQASGNE